MQPIDGCDINLGGGLKYNQSVETLVLTFTVQTPLVQKDTIEFALSGFKATFANMSTVVHESTITPPPPVDDNSANKIVYTAYGNASESSTSGQPKNCFEAIVNKTL